MKLILSLCLVISLGAQDRKFPYLHYACGLPQGVNSITDPNGMTWQSDASVVIAGSLSRSVTVNAPQGLNPVYSHARSSSIFTYQIPVPDTGYYWLVFHFIEPTAQTASAREIIITANGIPVALNLDLYATAGTLTPYDMFVPIAIFYGKLQIQLSSAIGEAILSGLELIPKPAPDALPPIQSLLRFSPEFRLDSSVPPVLHPAVALTDQELTQLQVWALYLLAIKPK